MNNQERMPLRENNIDRRFKEIVLIGVAAAVDMRILVPAIGIAVIAEVLAQVDRNHR